MRGRLVISNLVILAASGFAQTSLVLQPVTGTPGASATMSLVLTTSAGNPPAGLQWSLTYPALPVTFLQVSAGPAAAAGKTLSCGPPGSIYTCLLAGLNLNAIASGVVAIVTVGLAQATGDVPIGISSALAATLDGSGAPVSATGGVIHLAPPQVALSLAGLSCAPGLLSPDAVAICTVMLNLPATAATTIALSSDTPKIIKVPSDVSIPAGNANASFSARAARFTGTARVTASWQGTTLSVVLVVQYLAALIFTAKTGCFALLPVLQIAPWLSLPPTAIPV
jgi:hypothetical protein